MRKLLLFCSVWGILLGNVFAVEIPAYENFVNDNSDILSSQAEENLNAKLANYEAETGSEIAVLTIPLIPEGFSPNEYATAVGNAWGVGKAEVDNGVILLIETDDVAGERDIYIATGSQLEGGLTDIEARDIVDEVIIPYFQTGDFDGGVNAGVDAIIAGLNGESFTDLRMEATENNADAEIWFNVVFVLFFFVFPWLAAIWGRSKRIWPGGVVGMLGGGIGGMILGIAVGGIIATAIGMGLFGLFFDWVVSKNYNKAKSLGIKPSWWVGGGGFGGGSGGGGFGGFGGGGFSGGGGGGSW